MKTKTNIKAGYAATATIVARPVIALPPLH